MVSPINYILDIRNPIEEMMRGYSAGRSDIEQRQIMGLRESQEKRAQATFEEQQRVSAAARAEVERKRQEAEAGRAALLDYFDKQEARTATPDDLRRAVLQFPGMVEQFQAIANSFSEERLGNEIRFGKQLSFALANKNIEAARSLLKERAEAAGASGDERSAAAYKAKLIELDANPEGLLMQTLMPLAATLEVEDFNKFYTDTLGQGAGTKPTEAFRTLELRAENAGLRPGTPEYQEFMRSGGASLGANFRPATAEEAAQYGATSGQINETTGQFFAINPPTGFSIRATPEGGVELVQGPGADKAFTEGQSKDVVYASRAEGALREFEPVAEKLTSRTERLLEIVPLGLGRDYQDADYQLAQRSGTEFLQAILRKDTGAAITPAEQEEYGKVYLPQPGDKPEVLKARSEARKRAVAALKAGMTPQQMLAVERAIGLAPEAPATTAGGRIRFDAEGNRIE